jgi:hypothetical protein
MSNIRLGASPLLLGLALGPLGCPSDPVCPTCGLELRAASQSAMLSLVRGSRYAGDELVGTHVTVYSSDGGSETHHYPAERLPLVPGLTSRIEAPELFAVGERVTVRAEVTMTFRRQDTTTYSVGTKVPVRSAG